MTPRVLKPGTTALVKPAHWVLGTDGKQYAAVWGSVRMLNPPSVLGFDAPRAGYFIQVGDHGALGKRNTILIEGGNGVTILPCAECPDSADVLNMNATRSRRGRAH
jgi:hypothetical protein